MLTIQSKNKLRERKMTVVKLKLMYLELREEVVDVS